jgi:hypothetical protein
MLIGWCLPVAHLLLVTPVLDSLAEGFIMNGGLVALGCGIVVNGGDMIDETPMVMENGIARGLDRVTKVVESLEERVVQVRVLVRLLNRRPNLLSPARNCFYQESVLRGTSGVLLGGVKGH